MFVPCTVNINVCAMYGKYEAYSDSKYRFAVKKID